MISQNYCVTQLGKRSFISLLQHNKIKLFILLSWQIIYKGLMGSLHFAQKAMNSIVIIQHSSIFAIYGNEDTNNNVSQ